jgi:hypothetical protein
MAANTNPIFTLTPNIGVAQIGATANVKSDGAGTIGTDMMKAFTAGSAGSYVSRIRFNPWASTAATVTVATVIRVFYSTLTSGTSASTNTYLLYEFAAAAQTADQTVTATFYIEVPLGFAMPTGSFLHCSSHIINNSSTGWVGIVFGGDY